jgi:hypothetical protein
MLATKNQTLIRKFIEHLNRRIENYSGMLRDDWRDNLLNDWKRERQELLHLAAEVEARGEGEALEWIVNEQLRRA